tara:strand:+ start:357 stop:1049 length:693 start_codon:yes stop_codon:yes gene_type:complete
MENVVSSPQEHKKNGMEMVMHERMRVALSLCVVVLGTMACGSGALDGEFDVAPLASMKSGLIQDAVLALVNDPEVGFELFDDDIGLDRRAAAGLVLHRDGPDEVAGTGDDNLFDDIDELDAIRYVGRVALRRLELFALAYGYDDLVISDADRRVLAFLNDPRLTFSELDDDARLNRRAASSLYDFRAGNDGSLGNSDDQHFETMAQVDAQRYVGERALAQLRAYVSGWEG